jgi:dCTP deaminase
MILCDFEILNLCQQGMVQGFDPELINPASLDVRLGDTLLIESAESPELVPYPLDGNCSADPYLLRPGQFVLAQTREVFNIPANIVGEFRLKSSRAREGMDQALAVWLDPGWHGSVLTLELRNNRQLWSQPLYPGLKIGQVIFHRMSQPPGRTYAETGRYNRDMAVQESRG